ncbi:hypothetical protein LCE44_05900 [Vibrio harveyi]|uniref:lipopolysaccharide biosynthesis protein n=1 Tax=Vibrio harveyi TaxID=669 RepID=UPI00069F88B5|nr:hypothetical protein [Vibrio harveyi]EKO3861096.1 hypothetical protein [Vibrio harveyi]KNY45945.1 hypothetical protein AKG94_10820 [Vibrio harveyi]MCQ9084824.1 hypothetical protein [Vibrio harveyi]HDM8133121.1 hypothetical protein [Vibrio harveyi]
MNINFFQQIISGGVAKVFSALVGFMLVSVSIRFLGGEKYGLWMSMYTFVTWFSMLDFGIGGGLRNKLSESLAEKDYQKAKEYVSTAYISLAIICLGLIIALFSFSQFINWGSVFSLDPNLVSVDDFIAIIQLTIVTFLISLFFKLCVNVSFSYHKSQHSTYVFLAQQLFGLIVVFTLSYHGEISLEAFILYGFVINSANFFVLVIFNVYIFFSLAPELKPSLKYFHFDKLKSVFNLGGKIFLIQICAVCLYSTDIFLLNKYDTPISAAKYAVLQKYFGIAVFASSILVAPVWSAITCLKNKGDLIELRSFYQKLLKLFSGIILMLLVLYFSFQYVAPIWLGDTVSFHNSSILLMAVYTGILIYLQLLSSFLNGYGTVFIQLVFASFAAVINIIVTVWVLKIMNGTIEHTLLISIIANLPSVIIFSVQVSKLLNNQAKGIWSK